MTPTTSPEHSPLGKSSAYADQYDPSLLFPLPRQTNRTGLGIAPGQALPFFGADLWTGYELSWLNLRGKPQVALLQAQIPCETPNLIESKSFKLYLNSFNNSRFASSDAVREHLRHDLSAAAWHGSGQTASIGLRLVSPEDFDQQAMEELSGLNLDRLDVECSHYHPAPELLSAKHDEPPVTEVLTSRLLKSNCLVTGQPDWGSVQISYSGAASTKRGCCATSSAFATTTSSTSNASNASSWTSGSAAARSS